MRSMILRGAAKLSLVVLLLIVAAVAAFRIAAAVRETAGRDALAPTTGRWVATRSGDVFIQEKGPAAGTPVVLFHGTAAWSELWRATTDALAGAGYHVIALDLPPFGFSDRPGSYTRQDQAERVNDVLVAAQRVTPPSSSAIPSAQELQPSLCCAFRTAPARSCWSMPRSD